MTVRPIGILSALPQELETLASGITQGKEARGGSDRFISGFLGGLPVVATLSGMGKVNAAVASQRLISEFRAKALIFSGVGGGLNDEFNIGDIVIGERVFQHDVGFLGEEFKAHAPGVLPEIGMGTGTESVYYDLRTWPFREGIGEDFFSAVVRRLTDQRAGLSSLVVNGQNYLPHIRRGTIATGDQFIADETKKQALVKTFGADVVEMEGGAVAQVAHKNGIPCLILRAISDKAGTHAKFDFQSFLTTVAANNAQLILKIVQQESLLEYLKNF